MKLAGGKATQRISGDSKPVLRKGLEFNRAARGQ
jgi:hypothetical protein